MNFLSGSDVYFNGKRFVVVRGRPDSDGDIVVRDPRTSLEHYMKAARCVIRHTANVEAPPVPPVPKTSPFDGCTVESVNSVSQSEPVAQPIQTQGNQTMSQVNTSRRSVSVTLIDRDVNLEGKEAIVLDLGQQISEGDQNELIQELIMDPANKVAEALKSHNDKRSNVVNREVLNRTGNKVKLEPVKMRDLTWDVR